MRVLQRLSLENITNKHVFWLVEMVKISYFGETAVSIIQRAAKGECQLWGFEKDKGVIVTEILQHPSGKEVFICGFAGDRVLAKVRTIKDDLMEFTKEMNARWLGGEANNERAGKLFEKIKEKKISSRYIMEV